MKLNFEQIEHEMKIIADSGMEEILILTGESHSKSDVKYIGEACKLAQKYFRNVNNMSGANPGNVWEFSHVHYCNKNRKKHPTQKPEALFERIILASSNEGDTVLDPFTGSGTSLRVCQQLNRNAIGIDINSDYIKMTNERLSENFSGFDSFDERKNRDKFDCFQAKDVKQLNLF